MEKEKRTRVLWAIIAIVCLFTSGLLFGATFKQIEIKQIMDDNDFIFCSKDVKVWYDMVHNSTDTYLIHEKPIKLPVTNE